MAVCKPVTRHRQRQYHDAIAVPGFTTLGQCQEWYTRKVKHPGRAKRDWTLESAIIALQTHFLHMLTHRQALLEFNAARQGNGTVQDLLIKLDKLTARMVEPPSSYMLRVCFIEALCEPLKREVLR